MIFISCLFANVHMNFNARTSIKIAPLTMMEFGNVFNLTALVPPLNADDCDFHFSSRMECELWSVDAAKSQNKCNEHHQ